MTNFAEMGKVELRAACKAAGISYGKLNNDGMRAALVTKKDAEIVIADPSTMTYNEVYNAHCPHCKIHLSNGLLTCDDEVANSRTGQTLYEAGELNFEYECMGCGHGFGKELEPFVKKAAADNHTGNGLKIEKNRVKQNGVTRPSAGGKCRAVWDALDAYVAEMNENPTVAIVKDIAADEGWNQGNAVIEFYQWRKFNGISGRK